MSLRTPCSQLFRGLPGFLHQSVTDVTQRLWTPRCHGVAHTGRDRFRCNASPCELGFSVHVLYAQAGPRTIFSWSMSGQCLYKPATAFRSPTTQLDYCNALHETGPKTQTLGDYWHHSAVSRQQNRSFENYFKDSHFFYLVFFCRRTRSLTLSVHVSYHSSVQ